MLVGLLKADIHLQGITSLKQKRGIVKSLVERLKNRFNISVSQVSHQDNKAKAVIGIAIVSNDIAFIDKQLDTIITFMENDGRFYLGNIQRESFSNFH